VSKRIEMPGFIKPQLATLKSKAPKGRQWLHEIKYDGYRVQVHLNRGRKKVFTRDGLDWTKRFTEIAGALAIPGEAIIDGEVVVVHEAAPTFPNSRRNSPRAGRAGSSTTPSICYGGMATFASCRS
jgi:bifunctional non-homologous end joining protein LigD